ncbi:MAG: DUF4388 domain-containing protein [Myxococcota bacterium]
MAVLLVEGDDTRRYHARRALASRSLPCVETTDAFHAMSALGRAAFGAVLATEEKRHFTLRSMCTLADRRHPGIRVFVLATRTPAELLATELGPNAVVLAPGTTPEQAADLVRRAVVPELEEAFDVDDEAELEVEAAAEDVDVLESVEAAEDVEVAEVAEEAVAAEDVDLDLTEPAPGLASPAPEPEIDVEAAEDEASDVNLMEERTPVPSPVPVVPATSTKRPLFEGTLEDEAGPPLLVAIFSQALTGRLTIQDGQGSAVMFFLRGYPVWAVAPQGDGGLARRLVEQGLVPSVEALPRVPEGQLLGALANGGQLRAQALHQFMLGLVREQVMQLCRAGGGEYQFQEDKAFLDDTLLFKVNPLGLIFEAKRRTMTPDRVLAEGFEMARKYLQPGPALKMAAPRLKQFVKGLDVSELIDGAQTVEEFCNRTSLGTLMGTLMTMVLVNTRLATITDAPRELAEEVLLDDELDISDPRLVPLADYDLDILEDEATTDAAVQQARDAVFLLYTRLKALTDPCEVLGVPRDAPASVVHEAHQRLTAELDQQLAAGGGVDLVLQSRVMELKRKVDLALGALLPASW